MCGFISFNVKNALSFQPQNIQMYSLNITKSQKNGAGGHFLA